MMQNGIKFFASECHISKMLARQKAILSWRVHDSEGGNPMKLAKNELSEIRSVS
jgi:hypothetical protein